MSASKKRLFGLILTVALVVGSVGILQNSKVVDAADNRVLLEKRHPGYWNYLTPTRERTIYIPPIESKNLIVSDIETQMKDGITLTVNDNRTITLNGTNTSDDVINFVLGNLCLSDGEYIMTDGMDSASGANLYIWANALKSAVAYGNNVEFEVDNKKSIYHCGIHVDPGVTLNNVIVMPMIRQTDNASYVPYLNSSQCDRALVFSINGSEVKDDDLQLLGRTVKYQNNNYKWISIRYPDGSGVQWKDGIKIEGHLDCLGRILNS